MSIEPNAIEVRAGRHAALADPTRLRVVDLLAMSDASPAELETLLNVRSNLLAHHVKQLEEVGLVSRTRSEADRRRTYLHLETSALEGLVPPTTVRVPRVVFVCTGNAARSQFAAALWNERSTVPVASAGTHPAATIAAGAIATARRHGIALADISPKGLADVLRPDDLVVTVCDGAHEELRSSRALHWSVPDPVLDGSDAAFEAAFARIAARIDDLAPHVLLPEPNVTTGVTS